MNSPAGEPHGSKRTPLPNPLPARRGEGEATPRSLSGLIQRQCTPALSLRERGPLRPSLVMPERLDLSYRGGWFSPYPPDPPRQFFR